MTSGKGSVVQKKTDVAKVLDNRYKTCGSRNNRVEVDVEGVGGIVLAEEQRQFDSGDMTHSNSCFRYGPTEEQLEGDVLGK